ncbi:MAG TPA: hypothetical protein VJ608_14175 [Albitalea sp.]|nr:hypothetical protein [Albitalea sp.]
MLELLAMPERQREIACADTLRGARALGMGSGQFGSIKNVGATA